jgi:hypothetical protein
MKRGETKNAPFLSMKGVSQPLTVDRACAISPEHFEGESFELFLCKVLQENTSQT